MAEKLGGVTTEGVSRDILRMLVIHWVNDQFSNDYTVLTPQERVLGSFHHMKEAFKRSLSTGDDKEEVFNFCVYYKPQEYLGVGMMDILDMDFYNYEKLREKMIEVHSAERDANRENEEQMRKGLEGKKR